MPKEYNRAQRFAELLQRELAVLIQQEVKDPRLGMVTVSAVKVSRDLAYAKVYISVLGNDADIKANLKVLKNASGFLRSMLAQRVRARTIPQLNFVYDKSIVEGERLANLIDAAIVADKRKFGSEEE